MKLPILISLALFSFSTATRAAPTELEGERAAATSACPSPEEARAKMTVPAGYEVRCFAHEPLVVNPVAMTWDARGRLWVVEAYEYPEGTPLPIEKRPFGAEAKDDQYHPVPSECLANSAILNPQSAIPKDRVVILEDTDNDGVADKRTVFVAGLNLASAIICGDDGIYVGQQPHIIHFKDSNHDDKPDEWRVILTGFGREDTHELVNSFTWGPDGWLYMTHGVFTHSAVRRPGQPEQEGFKFDAGMGRARPLSVVQSSRLKSSDAAGTAAPPWEFEVFADGTSNPWGCDYDAAGNFFVSACVIDHFFHMAPGGIYVRQGGAPENPYSYELLPSIVKHRHFRAAYAGVQIYQGGAYPQDTWGHAFIGNIHDNAIHEEVLTPVGSTFKCEPRRDFLRANNGWFRPVSTQTGPDGNLWIMDWCDKYPCYQNAKANPAGVDRDRGRIWRVVWKGQTDSKTASTGEAASAEGEKPPFSADRQSLVRHGQSFVGDGKGLVHDGKGILEADQTQSETEKTLSVTDKTQSTTDKPLSATDQTFSVTNKTQSATDQTQSVADKTQSVTEKVLSEPEKGASAIKTINSEPRQDHSRPETTTDLAKLTTPELVKLLEHPNNWMRRKARRTIVERCQSEEFPFTKSDSDRKAFLSKHGPMADDLLEKSFETALGRTPPDRRTVVELSWTMRSLASACWQVSTFGGVCGQWGERLAQSTNAELRKVAVSLLAEFVSANDAMVDLSSDNDPMVRSAVAARLRLDNCSTLTVDSWLADPFGFGSEKHAPFTALLRASAENNDPLLSFQIWMAIEPDFGYLPKDPRLLEWLADLAPATQPLSQILTLKSMRRLCDTRNVENLDLALDFLVKIKDHDVLLAHALEGLVKGQEGGVIKPTKDVSALLSDWREHANADVRKSAFTLSVLWGDAGAISHLAAVLVTPKAPSAGVLDALQRLRGVTAPAYKKALLKLIREGLPSHPAEVAITAIRSAADLGSEEFTVPLTKLAASKDYNTQLAALSALSNRAEWTHAMLDAIEARKINTTGFPVSVRRALATSKDKAIRDHASKVLGAWKESGDDTKALIAAKKTACLEGEADLANGKTLFTATCGVCHTFYGGGQKVGPELIGSGRSNLDALLANVIDPNQIIGNGYENFIVTTNDNRTLAGRVTEDTPSHVKLLAIGGAESVVPRDQIAKLDNTHQSVMPMGFGNLPDAAFRDIIWYLLAPPEEGPLTPEKKKLLSTSIDLAAPAKPKGTDWRAIDWESVSHWNPDWKVSAPEFERTPEKLAEYHGKTNVLLMHPFPDKKTPASLERKVKVEAGKTKLRFSVAADDRGDWELRITVNGNEYKKMIVDHEQPRWKHVEFDLVKFEGQEVTIRLEGHPTGWSWEFGYWHGIELR